MTFRRHAFHRRPLPVERRSPLPFGRCRTARSHRPRSCAAPHRNGVQALALTDHDELGGLARRRRRRRVHSGLVLHSGGGGVGQLGRRDDPRRRPARRPGQPSAARRPGQPSVPDASSGRGRWPAALEAVGIPDAFEGALRYVGNPDLISRSHFARHIVDSGACSDMHDVFGRYPHPRQARLRRAPLGDPARCARLDQGRRRNGRARASGALPLQRDHALGARRGIPRSGRRRDRGAVGQSQQGRLRALREVEPRTVAAGVARLRLPRPGRKQLRSGRPASDAGPPAAGVVGLAPRSVDLEPVLGVG